MGHPPQAGPAPPRAGAWVSTGVAIVFAMAAPVAHAGAGVAGSGRPAAGAASPGQRAEPIAFAKLPWGAAPPAVARALAKLGFRRVASSGGEADGEVWRGRWLGEPATCMPELRRGAGFVSVTLRFEPETPGDAGQLYRRYLADMDRRYGRETAGVERQRAGSWVRDGLRWRHVPFGDPAGARLWAGADGAAAALQLDGRSFVWLRWEAPGWKPDEGDADAGE